jgi:hypothetical protein
MKTRTKPPADPLIDDVRRTRERLVRKHGGLRGWAEHLRQLQKGHPEKVIPTKGRVTH